VPRYFFHVRDSKEIIDKEGLLLSDPDEARMQAVVAAGEMLKDFARKFWTGTEWRMWVTDETGKTVCALRFAAEVDQPE
jgi:Domain of unknown function (DUF6894)